MVKMAAKNEEDASKKFANSTAHYAFTTAASLKTLMLKLFYIDKSISERMSICSDASNDFFGKGCLRSMLIFLELTGHGVPWLFISCFLAYNYQARLGEFSVNLLLAIIFDLAVVGVMKVLVKRKRPVYNKDDMMATVKIDRFSFPSGHSTRGMLVAVLIMNFSLDSVYIALVYIWALVLALSRIVLGRHYVSDVLAGILIGIFEAMLVLNYLWIDTKSLEHIILSTIKATRNQN